MSIVSKSNRRADDLTALFVAGLNGVKPASAPRTIGDLLNTLMPALDAEGWEIADGSVSVTGLTVTVGTMQWRISFDPECMLFPTQEAYESKREYADFLRAEDKRRNQDEDAADARSSAFLGHDAAGFNGQESSDVDF
jgi:hypothetical protein